MNDVIPGGEVPETAKSAVLDAGLCHLGRQPGYAPGQSPRSGGNQLCGLAAQQADDDEHYAVIAVGTSNWMCDALRTSPAGLVEVF